MVRPLTAFATLMLGVVVAHAAVFPDVSETSPYREAIEVLADLGVIQGNPDGTFAPDREVNRAEILTMLYRATGKAPRAVYKRCFPDVLPDSWYEEVVCDAEHEGYIEGNPDGSFRPAQSVNRVEGLKMVLNVLGFSVPTLTQDDRLSLDFLQVSHASWYAPYLHRALTLKLVPEAFTVENIFDPSLPLDRSEVAEILYRALHTEDTLGEAAQEEAPREEQELEEEMTEEALPSSSRPRPSPPPAPAPPSPPEAVSFPFNRRGKTGSRGSLAYTFELTERQTILLRTANLTSKMSGLSCFLYLLDEGGLPSELFIGFQEAGFCTIRAGARAGKYQLEARTPTTGSDVTVEAVESTGDGNDGPVEAVGLRTGVPRTGTLQANDYEDWFRFSLTTPTNFRVNITPVGELLCTIHPGKDVDLFGFEDPQCGQTLTFQSGTYYVSLQRLRPPAAKAYTYTIDLR